MEVPLSKAIVLAFLAVILAGIALPTLYFIMFSALVAGVLILGIFEMAGSEGKKASVILTLSIIIGTIGVGIIYTEFGHAAAATISPDLSVESINVTLLQYNGGGEGVSGIATIGYVEVGVSEAAAASGAANGQLAFTALAGSIALAMIAAGYWFVPTPTNIPAVIWTIMLFAHQLPFLPNDISMSVANGWMSGGFAWMTTLIIFGVVFATIMRSMRRGDSLLGGMTFG